MSFFDYGPDMDKSLLQVLRGDAPWRRPIWLMRQAGRYLPEYRKLRANAGSFLDLCYSPDLAAEVTLQPLRRFDLDAAILFADILLVPDALGCDVTFKENEGPKLGRIQSGEGLKKLSQRNLHSHLQPVFETIGKVKSLLPGHIGFIGFCGAPWTVATYMVEGGTSPDRQNTRLAAYGSDGWFDELIELLIESSIEYLCWQIEAGVEVVQIFDTWAGDLPDGLREKYCFDPIRRIVQGVNSRCKGIPIIGFVRGIGSAHLEFAKTCGLDAVGVEWPVSCHWIADHLQPEIVVQGNLDPLCLKAGSAALERGVRHITDTVQFDRHIMNLGHGIRPDTPLENVGKLVDLVRQADEARF